MLRKNFEELRTACASGGVLRGGGKGFGGEIPQAPLLRLGEDGEHVKVMLNAQFLELSVDGVDILDRRDQLVVEGGFLEELTGQFGLKVLHLSEEERSLPQVRGFERREGGQVVFVQVQFVVEPTVVPMGFVLVTMENIAGCSHAGGAADHQDRHEEGDDHDDGFWGVFHRMRSERD